MVLSTENIIFRKPDYFTSGRAQQFVLTTTSGVVPEGSKLRFIYLLWLQVFVVQFPRNTRSLEVVSISNFTGPLKSQDFNALNGPSSPSNIE